MEIKAEGTNTVPADTVFENRGFMADITADDGQPELTAEEADAIMSGGPGAAQAAAPVLAEEGAEEAAPEAPAPAKVRIGGKEFATAEEAWTYAQELEQEKIAADAFRQGVEAAAQAQPSNPAPQPQEPEQIDPLFYTDPAAYFRKREAEVAARVAAEVNQSITIKERNAQTWNKFYSDYPDLSKAQPLVQLVLNQHWNDLQHVETGKALKIIAEKTRAMKREMLADELPGQTLPRVAQTASSGRGVGVTPKPAQEQDLNFIAQMRTMTKKRTSRMRR